MHQTPADIILLGAAGMLGVSWHRALQTDPSQPRVRALDLAECDITDEASVRAALTPATPGGPPPLVINCAAYTAVDQAEQDEARATLINGAAVGILARRCREIGATLVHYSTDYVFDGRPPHADEPGAQATGLQSTAQSRPLNADASLALGARHAATTGYPNTHPRSPINAYGRSKAAGEIALERMSAGADGPAWNNWLCLRTSWLYAAHAKNFVLTIAGASRTKPVLRVVNDQRGRPTSCDNLVRITRSMLDKGARGMHHGCDSGHCTWFEFAAAIVDRVNLARLEAGEREDALCRVDPCSTDEFPRPARRPAYSVLDLTETERLIGPVRHWRVCLSHVLDDVLGARRG